jgi:two-component system chemotaxis sensor kinase CheA
MDEILKDFLLESYENLDRLDQDFVALETNPTAQDKLGSIFRTIHTIKGTCGCLGLSKLEAVAHVGENLLCRVRDGDLQMNTAITTALLRLADAIREMLAHIEATAQESDKDYSAICKELIRLNEEPSEASVPVAEEICSDPEIVSATAEPTATIEPPVAAEPIALDPEPMTIAPAAETVREKAAAPAEKEKHSESLSSNAIRVDVELLDKLMNLVGELVLARNQVLQFTAGSKDAAFQGTTQRLNLITTELQESVMKTRMQPIDSLWSKFPRIVRDVSKGCGKKIRIEMEGRETELDKTILEAIKDPLTHILRNSIDHGVETPQERLSKGKPEEGVLLMRAFHEGGQVNIEIIDDGGGINPERVKKKALEKGLISAEHAARMSDRDAIALIFLPGFSTAEKITNVSGRGVGMDVVKTNVERIGGTVDVQSKLGEGTTLRIKIPLTLAIIPALVVTSGGERFAIPQVSLLELVRVDGKEDRIESIQGAPVYRLRGKLLPLVELNQVLNLPATVRKGSKDTASNIVVLRAGEHQFGLVVDQVNDTEEIVVKPLWKDLKTLNVFAGATIMGDGCVALILDVMGVAQKSNVIAQATEEPVHEDAAESDSTSTEREMLLLCKLQGGRRMAIPLAMVARLEEFPRTQLEEAGSLTVVQYRGQIMPIIDLAGAIGESQSLESGLGTNESNNIQVVVYSHQDRNIGLRVEQVQDIVEERVCLQATGQREGVRGTVIIKEKVTELLDVKAVVEKAVAVGMAA